ncbi:unnamed protein product [Pieris macdunnoughi]|uniref:Uncharacterized protein n=1 Tax=Pieris macdunnoughi TaxID=345717 RepID=A0A821QUM0_9NEOP|nr:unnamed protein product [Pieris macdunnoughi]
MSVEVGHEKSRSFAGCPYQRLRGNFHLTGSRDHTALVDDRRAFGPQVAGGGSRAQGEVSLALPLPYTPAHSLLAGNCSFL